MSVYDILKSKYTHIHFAFGDISSNFEVRVGSLQDEFKDFLKADLGSTKKILAFGGWAFSTEIATHAVFRVGVQAGSRELLASNLAQFVIEHKLDGVDFDWECLGAPDMIWLPASSTDEGFNYLEFLKLMRHKLPNKSLSIAAPASYWYLKAFPIGKISEVVDYIVYMTYNLHGQWDWGNKWSIAGCERETV